MQKSSILSEQVFLEMQSAIENEISEIAQTISQDVFPIYDGIADYSAYVRCPYKIAWVLKEPYDNNDGTNPTGGGWSIPRDCFLSENRKWTVLSWQRVIYVMYGLLNNLSYKQMDYVRNDPEMGEVLKAVAWINLSKMPGHTSSGRGFADYYHKYWKPIVNKQIDLYCPDVIVFGNTLSTCHDEFLSPEDVPVEDVVCEGKTILSVYLKGGKVLIDAYHPGIRYLSGVNDSIAKYVDSIIDVIRKYCTPLPLGEI